jgi:hypothetical protein
MIYKEEIRKLETEISTAKSKIERIKSDIINSVEKVEGTYTCNGEEFKILSHSFFLNYDLDTSHQFLIELKNTRTKNLSKKGDEPKIVNVKYLSVNIINGKSSTAYWADKVIIGYGTSNLLIESSNESIADELKKRLAK